MTPRPLMKTYTVLYAVDVPHYGSHEIQAQNDDAAIYSFAKVQGSDCKGIVWRHPATAGRRERSDCV